ncbi:hypothetical protein F4779DRAFT_621350 [Xylariaceae sp. FL0662B]|nr:hypothetical protein F4779DRAFT_621350 [Xylariaceae sp. FL0662B]
MRVYSAFLSLWAGSSLASVMVRDSDGVDIGSQLAHNYSIVDITWKGFDGVDPEKEFTGSLESVIGQLKNILGPNFTHADVAKQESATKDAANPPSTNLRRICNVGGIGTAEQSPIRAGIAYLASLNDTVRCSNQPPPSPGQGACGRISCSWNGAIWWCNDNNHTVEFACNLFAKYAEDIVENCSSYSGKTLYTQGQEFDDDFGINTIAALDEC